MKVVCDSTALIGLAKIRKIELLKQIYREVFIQRVRNDRKRFRNVILKEPFGTVTLSVAKGLTFNASG